MKKLILLPLIAAATLGLAACTKHTDADNSALVTNDIDLNSSDDITLNSEDANFSSLDGAADNSLDNASVNASNATGL